MDWLSADVLQYATIPVVAGLIGYGTNWLAVRMTFWPLAFVGPIDPWLGWQGIIPSKSRKMAAIAVDSTLSRLGTLSEIVEQMDPGAIADHLVAHARPRVPAMVEEIALRENPALWRSLPPALRTAVVARVQAQLPRAARGLMDDVVTHVDQLLDLRMMVIDLLGRRPDLTNRMFLEAGAPEFRFIVKSGLWFGFALGLVQMAVQVWLQQWWVLPVFGVVVGYLTNWLALTLIFEPVEPRRLGRVTFHGLFLRRQEEIAGVYCRLVTREVLTLRNLVEYMLDGPSGDRTRAMVDRHVQPIVDEALGVVRPVARRVVGPRDWDEMKGELAARAIEVSLDPLDDPVFSEERARMVEQAMRERMVAMDSREFSNLLRPAFEEDELKLILVGAALGGLAGAAQSLLVF